MESPVSFTGHQEAREICLRGGKSGFPDVAPAVTSYVSPLGGFRTFLNAYTPGL